MDPAFYPFFWMSSCIECIIQRVSFVESPFGIMCINNCLYFQCLASEGSLGLESICPPLHDGVLSRREGRGTDETLSGKIWPHRKAAGASVQYRSQQGLTQYFAA